MAKAKPTPTPEQTELRRARVLVRIFVDGEPIDPDNVVELPAEQLEHFVAIGAVDPDPEAVAYVESLKG